MNRVIKIVLSVLLFAFLLIALFDIKSALLTYQDLAVYPLLIFGSSIIIFSILKINMKNELYKYSSILGAFALFNLINVSSKSLIIKQSFIYITFLLSVLILLARFYHRLKNKDQYIV